MNVIFYFHDDDCIDMIAILAQVAEIVRPTTISVACIFFSSLNRACHGEGQASLKLN